MAAAATTPTYLPLRWESTGDQWWFASPIDWAAANGHYDLVRELLYIDTNLLIKLTSLQRIRRLETVWDDDATFADVARRRSHVARKLLLGCETPKGGNSLIGAGYGGWLLYTAASAGDLPFVEELLRRDPLLVFGEGEYGVTDMLYAAARSKNSQVFRLLFDCSLSPKKEAAAARFRLEMEVRAVHAAARGGNSELLRELLRELLEMHEMVPGKRFDRYHELGQHAFGEKLGLYIVVPQQIVVDVSTCIIYMVTGGKSLKKTHESLCPDCKEIKLTYFILIFASVHFILSHLPNFNSISMVSLAAAVMSLTYSTIAWAAALAKGNSHESVDYSLRGKNTWENAFNFFNAMGDIAFAFAGHNVVLEIQATIPSTPEKPSKRPMWKGVIFAYIVVALCYFPVAFLGYYMFGNTVEDNILITLEKPRWLIACANIFVFVHVVGGYQIYAMPVFDMLETYLVKEMKLKPSSWLRFTTRTIYVGLTMFIAMTFPFFGGLVGFFGGFALAPTTYFLPCIIWLIVKKPKKLSFSWIINWVFIVLGFILMTLAPIGGLRNIILSAKSYKFYQ